MHKKAHLTISRPLGSTLRVHKGDAVVRGDVLLVNAGSETYEFNLAKLLSIPPKQVRSRLVAKLNESISKGGVIAQKKGALRSQLVKAPIEGTLVMVDEEKGTVGIRQEKVQTDVIAWCNGVIHDITDEALILEVSGTGFVGTAGAGKPVSGTLMVINESLDVLSMPSDLEECILVTKELYADMLAKADALGATAVIGESFSSASATLPFVLLADISPLTGYNQKHAFIYGDEKQILVIENDPEVKKKLKHS